MYFEIMKELTSVYGTHVLKSTAVKKWRVISKVEENRWAMMPKLVNLATACNVEKVKRQIDKDSRKTVRHVTDSIDISCTRVHKILRQNLEIKVCSKLVLKVLMPE